MKRIDQDMERSVGEMRDFHWASSKYLLPMVLVAATEPVAKLDSMTAVG